MTAFKANRISQTIRNDRKQIVRGTESGTTLKWGEGPNNLHRVQNLKYTRVTKIATWNIQSLNSWKIDQRGNEDESTQIEILGLSEVRCLGAGKIKTKHGVLYYSGNRTSNHYHGVTTLLSSANAKWVIDFFPIWDGTMVLVDVDGMDVDVWWMVNGGMKLVKKSR